MGEIRTFTAVYWWPDSDETHKRESIMESIENIDEHIEQLRRARNELAEMI